MEFNRIHRVEGVLSTIAYFRILVLMLAAGKSRRTPHPYTVFLCSYSLENYAKMERA